MRKHEEHVAVIGGGVMGAGIAHVFLAAASPVVIVESDADAAAAARERVAASARKAEERGKLPPRVTANVLLADLRTTDSVTDIGNRAKLVVEAVPEDLALKQRMLAAAEGAVPDADLASNTSSLSVTDLAAALQRPERFCGMHFFNPVPASALVEVVTHEGAADDTVTRALDRVRRLGLTPVTVHDAPGFASSRLGVAVGLEAIRMLADGVASAEDIDQAMRLGYRWPIGPLHLTDLVGLDVRLAIAEYLQERLGARFEPPQLLRDKVAAGELGKKSGQGFYTW
ncbi:MAG: 3-hydroxybutyryl-CoA dehydrogenase [Streptosporangiales bacterium]|nr:3-hydroxybutyryl-CoA dehydrogenase [Streptosporangiales bacterium]